MKKLCEKCNKKVSENEVVSIGVHLIGGDTLEPQAFQHIPCGGSVIKIMCECDEPQCAKCLSVNCQEKICPTHTKEAKIAWRKRWEQANKKDFPHPENY